MRICVTGAECTGKTSLALALGERLDAAVVREAVDDYFMAKAETGDVNVFAADIVRAVEIQTATEASAPQDRPIIIFDTDLFTIGVWCQRYLGRPFRDLDDAVRRRQDSDDRIDLFVLTAPDIPFEHNAIRGSAEERDVMHAVFQRALAASGYRYIEVYGTTAERCAQVVSALQLLAADFPLDQDAAPSHA
jgi:nicotinamide riboside kinase